MYTTYKMMMTTNMQTELYSKIHHYIHLTYMALFPCLLWCPRTAHSNLTSHHAQTCSVTPSKPTVHMEPSMLQQQKATNQDVLHCSHFSDGCSGPSHARCQLLSSIWTTIIAQMWSQTKSARERPTVVIETTSSNNRAFESGSSNDTDVNSLQA